MSMKWFVLVILVLGVIVVAPAKAAYVNSSDFTYKLEMDNPVSETDWKWNSGGSPTSTVSYSGGLQTITSYGGATGYFSNNNSMANEVGAGSWTMEIKIKAVDLTDVPNDPVTNSPEYAQIYFGNAALKGIRFCLFANAVEHKRDNYFYVNNNDGQFHVFRAALDAPTNQISLWRDGVLINTVTGGDTGNYLFWGDQAAPVVGGVVAYDYIRYTAGYYAAPEPATMTLLGIGLIGLLRKKG